MVALFCRRKGAALRGARSPWGPEDPAALDEQSRVPARATRPVKIYTKAVIWGDDCSGGARVPRITRRRGLRRRGRDQRQIGDAARRPDLARSAPPRAGDPERLFEIGAYLDSPEGRCARERDRGADARTCANLEDHIDAFERSSSRCGASCIPAETQPPPRPRARTVCAAPSARLSPRQRRAPGAAVHYLNRIGSAIVSPGWRTHAPSRGRGVVSRGRDHRGGTGHQGAGGRRGTPECSCHEGQPRLGVTDIRARAAPPRGPSKPSRSCSSRGSGGGTDGHAVDTSRTLEL